MEPIDLARFRSPVFFTGAGMSAECGVPTYRGAGGIWAEYRFEEYACEDAFDRDPQKVLDFHALRRQKVMECDPHAGHLHLARLQQGPSSPGVITQNTDGMLQRAGVKVDAELHGSLWRLRCPAHGTRDDCGPADYRTRKCEHCGAWLRPDITWFNDRIDATAFSLTERLVRGADLFVSVGTSGVVWPAAGFAQLARDSGALMVEINPEENEASHLFDVRIRDRASSALPRLFPATEAAT